MSSSTPRGGGPLGDDELERALSAGLSRAVGAEVDADALVRGAQAGARRIHRRRTTVRGTVAALCVFALLPVGISLYGGVVQGGESQASDEAPASAPQLASGSQGSTESSGDTGYSTAPDATPDAVEGGSGPVAVASGPRAAATSVPVPRGLSAAAGLPRSGGEIVVPDPALLTSADLGLDPVSVVEDSSGAATTSTTVVRLCGVGTPGEDLARGGRTVRWTGPAVGVGSWTVATAVRVFAADGATQQLAFLARSVGVCTQSPGVSRAAVSGLPGDDVLVAVLPESPGGDVTVVGAVRRGKVTAGVEVVVPSGAGANIEARRAAGVARVRTLISTAYERIAEYSTAADDDVALR